jgi:drug/metabolite transporter (DMT)-like permease
MVYIFLAYLLLALTFTFGKIALFYTTPYVLISYRMLVAAFILLGYQWWRKGTWYERGISSWKILIGTAFVYIYIPYVLEFWAMQYTTSIKTNLIFSVTPFVSAAMAYFLHDERINHMQFYALVLGFIGILPVLLSGTTNEQVAIGKWSISIPECAIIIAMLSGAYAWFLIKRLLQKGHSLTFINGSTMAIGGIGTACTSIVLDIIVPCIQGKPIQLVSNMVLFLWWGTVLILIANIILYPLYGWLLRRYSVTFLSFCGFLSPLFGAVFGWWFLSEKIYWYYGVSL